MAQPAPTQFMAGSLVVSAALPIIPKWPLLQPVNILMEPQMERPRPMPMVSMMKGHAALPMAHLRIGHLKMLRIQKWLRE